MVSRQRRLVIALGATAAATATNFTASAAGFRAQTIDDGVDIGYGLVTGDVDGDGKSDILLADKSEFRWYRNPDWTPSVLARNLTLSDNVCIAARDLDGDGKVAVAVGAQWNPGETENPAASGAVFLQAPDDRTEPLDPVQLPHDPTTHRMHWVATGSGGFALAVLPLHGRAGGTSRLGLYHLPQNPADRTDPAAWKVEFVDTGLHKTHNFDTDGASLTIGGGEGQLQWPSMERQADALGFGEVRRSGAIAAGISPMHGNAVRIGDGAGGFETVDESLNEGHALVVADLLGSGSPQVVAGWRKPDSDGKVGIKLYTRPGGSGGAWEPSVIDDDTMACEDLRAADLDGDGDLDLIAAGRATNNLVIYWNDN